MTGRTFDLTIDRTSVGRVDDNAFTIPEPSVWSHHCEIPLRGSDVVVKDLNSTNGSFIRINAWAGTFETLRRPIVLKGTGVSNVSINGEMKFRRTAM